MGVAGVLCWLAVAVYVVSQITSQPRERSTWNSKGMR